MKKILITLSLALATLALKAQTPSSYELSYDQAGNRTTRKLLVLGNLRIASSPQLSDTVGVHSFQLFPNPTSGAVEINTSPSFFEKEDKEIRVYDLSGTVVLQRKMQDQNLKIDLSTLPQGAYIVRLTARDFSNEWKVIKM